MRRRRAPSCTPTGACSACGPGWRVRVGPRDERRVLDELAAVSSASGGGLMILATVGFYEEWWIQILKAIVIFAVGLQLVPSGAARRAQAARALPVALRPQPRRALRRAAATRGHPQAADQGAVPPDHLDRLPVRVRAAHLDPHGRRGVRDDPLRQRPAHLRQARRAVRDGRLDRAALPVRVRRDRLLRDHARRLVLGLEVLVPRRDARRRAADLLRGLPGSRAGRRDHDRADALADRASSTPRRACGSSCRSSSAS